MIASRPPKQKPRGSRYAGLSDRGANLVIGVVTTVWAANIGAGMLHLNGYQPSEAVNGIFLVIVGGAFVLRRGEKDNDE